MKLAIIDIIGIPYDGTTVFKQGLGGSESAVIFVSRELAALGFDVTVFNTCNIDHAQPGVYDGVHYRPLEDLKQAHKFDVVISSRTVIPFCDVDTLPNLNDGRALQFLSYDLYNNVVKHAQQRVLWMHDTFCLGDQFIEPLAVNNRITDIFTLSDWHLTYVANCDHGARRNFEVLKDKIFITRNGAYQHIDEVDINAKDPNLFVYNASVTKGMVPLVNDIWPIVKQQIPQAKLVVIGGYYRFSESSEPDQQEKDWHVMANDPRNAQLDTDFTGVIPQSKIAEILARANFMIYPAAFPETFGISTIESLLYNTPVITCRFGALEEIALEQACYKIDYAIEPNGLFPNINRAEQVQKFAQATVEAYHNTYLHQQKQYACNQIKHIAGWDTVALQWKQKFYKDAGHYLSIDEYRQVSKINRDVHRIYKRRYHNTVELEPYRSNSELPIVVVSTYYNCRDYIARCIKSVAAQDYTNYTHILVDDASTDATINVAQDAIDQLPKSIRDRFIIVKNTENKGAVRNQYENFKRIDDPNSIVMILDGDDSLVNDATIFQYYNNLYQEGAEFTYGSCWSMVDSIPLVAQPYPLAVKQNGSYRQHKFNWGIPYTHLRTFKKSLFDLCDESEFKDRQGEWYRAGGDGAVFYSLIEKAAPDNVVCVQDIVVNYNDINPLNDYKVNAQEQNRNASEIASMQPKKKILIAIPTAKNIEPETFKAIYDLKVPEGYETHFQYFYGYNIDQIRNLIADWTVKGYDYLFSVDSDISFASDTLAKMLAHDVDVVSGLYIQRKPGQHILELYEHNNRGGVTNIDYAKIKDRGLVEIAGCGFGCCLIKKTVMQQVGYPQFEYHSALDHSNTISEDVDFCRKALAKGFRIFADTTIQCEHTGSFTFRVDNNITAVSKTANPVQPETYNVEERLRELGSQRLIPKPHVDYLQKIKDEFGYTPRVIYDVGACVLHWTNEAKRIWPESKFVVFEAMESAEFLYKEAGLDYHIGVLSDETGKTVEFYQNDYHPGGNSYYLENEKVSPEAPKYFNESNKRTKKTVTLDALLRLKKLPEPDFLKIDVQGAEMDILKGAQETLLSVNHVILELQEIEYNGGAPLRETVIEYMNTLGFECFGQFSNNGPDGDYHFVRMQR